ncbi:MAG: hypothetical protein JTT12_05680 [Candidatus Brockarchaeota archaeon]|nr:hypothetical protein [Candidatus Brockarchaeota archaeon]
MNSAQEGSGLGLPEKTQEENKQGKKVDIKEFIEKMRKYHATYCDYPCFTSEDVINLLLADELEAGAIERDEGTTIITTWGAVFGNLSYDHFIDSFNYVLRQYREKFEGE